MKEPTDHLRRYGENIASAVSPARSRVAVMRAIGQADRAATPRRTLQIAFGSVGIFLVANVVTAGVANAAVPGDVLYPIDRGYETALDFVGLTGDHSEERIHEAEVLLQRSDVGGAIDLVSEAVDLDAVRGAAAGLHSFDPADPALPEHVQDLVDHVHALVEARREGELEKAAEAEAAVNLMATQIGEEVRSSRAEDGGPPDHAGDRERPDHADEQDPPPDHRPDPNVPAEAGKGEGPPDGAGEPPTPASPPDNDPPTPEQGDQGEERGGGSGNGPQSGSGQQGADRGDTPAHTRPGPNGGRPDR